MRCDWKVAQPCSGRDAAHDACACSQPAIACRNDAVTAVELAGFGQRWAVAFCSIHLGKYRDTAQQPGVRVVDSFPL